MTARDVIASVVLRPFFPHGAESVADAILAALANDGWRIVKLEPCNDEFCTANGETVHVTEEVTP